MLEFETSAFPIRFNVAYSDLWFEALFKAFHASLKLGPEFVHRFTSMGLTGTAQRLESGTAVEGFVRIERVRGKTFEGAKVAMFEYSFVLCLGSKPVQWSCLLDPAAEEALKRPGVVWFSSPGGPLVLTAELKALAKSLR